MQQDVELTPDITVSRMDGSSFERCTDLRSGRRALGELAHGDRMDMEVCDVSASRQWAPSL